MFPVKSCLKFRVALKGHELMEFSLMGTFLLVSGLAGLSYLSQLAIQAQANPSVMYMAQPSPAAPITSSVPVNAQGYIDYRAVTGSLPSAVTSGDIPTVNPPQSN
ncbi:MAG: hypothetical protein K2X01_07085 [Cyanobacteria bacterium]|nr:hypothetical protein [Cyanobacteriota bacterium]